MSKNIVIFLGLSLLLVLPDVTSAADYRAALTKSLLFFEAQRSGQLPPNQRVQWRDNSGLSDGSDQKVNLLGGYYDAGDNVKFGFPMAYSITMLAWSVVEFGSYLQAQNELQNTLDAIKWGTDYFLRAHTARNTLYGQVGEGNSDHDCWQRPEDMTTPRTSHYIDEQHPGADLAAETAAALAAASIAFQGSRRSYSGKLLNHARQLFDFARNHPGLYHNSIPASPFYTSSGYEDELLWAAAWLHRASGDNQYSNYIYSASSTGGTAGAFSWDNKYVGAQILIAREVLHGAVPEGIDFREYKNNAEQFICNCVGKGSNNIKRTNGGLLWFMEWSNLQYVNSASFVISAYADYLSSARTNLYCPGGVVSPNDLINLVKSQMNYILGENPKGLSYMVGYGSNYPQQVHHSGASIVSIKKDRTFVSCKGGYDSWFNRNAANPNVLEGAIVGGPDDGDNYSDSRNDPKHAEPSTANQAPIVGVLARIA